MEIVRRDAKGLEGKDPVPYGEKKMSAGDQTLLGGDKYHQMCVQSCCLEANSCAWWWRGLVRSLSSSDVHLPGLPVCRIGPYKREKNCAPRRMMGYPVAR